MHTKFTLVYLCMYAFILIAVLHYLLGTICFILQLIMSAQKSLSDEKKTIYTLWKSFSKVS